MNSREPPKREGDELSHRKLFGLALVVVFSLVILSLLLFSVDGPVTGKAFFPATGLETLTLEEGQASLAFGDFTLAQGDRFPVALVARPEKITVAGETRPLTDFRVRLNIDPSLVFVDFESNLPESWEVKDYKFEVGELTFTYGTDVLEDGIEADQITLGNLWFAVDRPDITGAARVQLDLFEMFSSATLVASAVDSSRTYSLTGPSATLPGIVVDVEENYPLGAEILLDASGSSSARVDGGTLSYLWYDPASRPFSLDATSDGASFSLTPATLGTYSYRLLVVDAVASDPFDTRVAFEDVTFDVVDAEEELPEICLNVPENSVHCERVLDLPTESRESILVSSCSDFGVPYCTYTCADGYAFVDGTCLLAADDGNILPVARITSSTATLPTLEVASDSFPLVVTLSADSSTDADGTIVSYRWIVDGAEYSLAEKIDLLLSDYGEYAIKLEILDDKDGRGEAGVALEIIEASDDLGDTDDSDTDGDTDGEESSSDAVEISTSLSDGVGGYVEVDELERGREHRIVAQVDGPLPAHLFIVQISRDNSPVALVYQERDALAAGDEGRLSFEYLPEELGTYTIQGFVWESWPASGGASLSDAGVLEISGVE